MYVPLLTVVRPVTLTVFPLALNVPPETVSVPPTAAAPATVADAVPVTVRFPLRVIVAAGIVLLPDPDNVRFP